MDVSGAVEGKAAQIACHGTVAPADNDYEFIIMNLSLAAV